MNQIKQILLFALLLISVIGTAQTSGHETLKYDIISSNKSIGNLSVSKNQNGNTQHIEIISEVKVKLLFSIHIKYQLNCIYKDNELIHSSVTSYVNGKVHAKATAEKDENYYTVTKDGHSSKHINDIHFSNALLYFNEPKGISSLFSEIDAFDKPIKKIAENEYQITDSHSGHLNTYLYNTGVLQEATIHHSLLSYKMILKK